MDRNRIIYSLVPDVSHYNPACLDYSEEKARLKGFWTDERPMPTIADCEVKQIELEALDFLVAYKEQRKKAYNAAGLTESRLIELWIEGDEIIIAQARADRDEIRSSIPKP